MSNSEVTVLGVIGGSGLYDIPGVTGAWREIVSPWGRASAARAGARAKKRNCS